jgi:2-polyprenyl-3-methyl-5-hydroxy-6-metoxy-1,4-benzoquinol methylase
MIQVVENAVWNLNGTMLKVRDEFTQWVNTPNKVVAVSQCPLCQSNQFSKLSNVDRFGLNFESLMCRECRLVFTSPQIKEMFLPEYYNRFYHPLIFGSNEAKEYLFDSEQGHKIFRCVYPFLNKKEYVSVFEVGAGSGSNLKAFRDSAVKHKVDCLLEGLEYSEAYVQKALEHNIHLFTDSLEQYIEKYNKKYDVIILSHVFEHVSNVKEFLANLKYCMHEDTLVYVEVPGILMLHKNSAYHYTFKRYLVHAHLYHFTAETLEKVFSNSGFMALTINEMVEAVFKYTDDVPSLKCKQSSVEKYLKQLSNYKYYYMFLYIFDRIKHKIIKVKNKIFGVSI